MIRGSKLWCKGIPGDGCGGDREFYIEDDALIVYDPFTKQTLTLIESIKGVMSIEKKGCEIFLHTSDTTKIFNLSSMQLT